MLLAARRLRRSSPGSIVGGYFAITHLPGVLATRRLDRRLHDVVDADAGATPRRPTRRF